MGGEGSAQPSKEKSVAANGIIRVVSEVDTVYGQKGCLQVA